MSQNFGTYDEYSAVNLLFCRLPSYIRRLGIGKLENASLAINPLYKEYRLSLTPYDHVSSPFLLLVAAEKAMLSSSYLSARALDELPIWKVYSEVRKWCRAFNVFHLGSSEEAYRGTELTNPVLPPTQIAKDFVLLQELLEHLHYSGSDVISLRNLYPFPEFHHHKADSSSSCNSAYLQGHPTIVRSTSGNRHAALQHEVPYKRSLTYNGERRSIEIRQKMDAAAASESSKNTSSLVTSTSNCMTDCIQQLVSFTQIRLCMASAYRDIVIGRPWANRRGYSRAISVVMGLRDAASELLHYEQFKPLRELLRAELLITERVLLLCNAFSEHDMLNTSLSLVRLRSSINGYINYLCLKEKDMNSDTDMEDQPVPRILLWAKAVASGVERRYPLFFPRVAVERLESGITEDFEKFVNDYVSTSAFEAFDFEGGSNRHAVAALVLDLVSPVFTGPLEKRWNLSVNGSYVFPFERNYYGVAVESGSHSYCNSMGQGINDSQNLSSRSERNFCPLTSFQWHIVDDPVIDTNSEASNSQCSGVSSTGTDVTSTSDIGGFDTRKIIFMRYASEKDKKHRYTFINRETDCIPSPSHSPSLAHRSHLMFSIYLDVLESEDSHHQCVTANASEVLPSNDLTNLHGSGSSVPPTTNFPETRQNAETKGINHSLMCPLPVCDSLTVLINPRCDDVLISGRKGDCYHNMVQVGELPISSTTSSTSLGWTEGLWSILKSAMLDGPEGTCNKSEIINFGPPVAVELVDAHFPTIAYVARVTQRLNLVIAVRSDKRHANETRVISFASHVLHQLRDEASFEKLLPER